MDNFKQQYKDYKLYTKIQGDSRELSIQLKRNMKNFSNSGCDMFIQRNFDLVMRHLKQTEVYI